MTVPDFGPITVEEWASPLRVKTRAEVPSKRIASASSAAGIRPKIFEGFQIEHHYRFVFARSGKPMANKGDNRGSMCTVTSLTCPSNAPLSSSTTITRFSRAI
jgi:hypothetical protein